MTRSFLSMLEQQDRSRIALISPDGRIRLAELMSRAHERRSSTLAEARHALVRSNAVDQFIVDLLAFDGFLKAFLLQPRSEDIFGDWEDFAASSFGGPLLLGEMTTWVMGTSGTTGTPKLIPHNLASVTATTKTDLAVGARHRWGLLYDPARFAGLQVLLQALISGAVLVAPEIEQGLDSALGFMADHGVTSLSATPSYWRKILMSPEVDRLQLTQLTLGGEIADQAILSALRRAFPEGKIVHIYASTEAGVGFSVSDGKAGFPARYLSDGALKGVQLRVRDDGHLLIRKTLDAGPPINAEFLDTEDLVEVKSDRVHFLGRASGAINVGGNKVMPEKVEAVLCSHPDVVAARVFRKPNSLIGNLVVAEVQISASSARETAVKELNELCRAHLERWQCPAAIRVVELIGLAASGKVSRTPSHG
jgi:acyl-coenzyme A synthetase/AMP-(fatty) acid ligase